jgi:hypothetical protein
MTLRKLAETVLALLESDPEGKLLDVPVFAVHSGNGASHDVVCVFVEPKQRFDKTGPLCDVADGTRYIQIGIDH